MPGSVASGTLYINLLIGKLNLSVGIVQLVTLILKITRTLW
jgi:hypothetical protein